jgi:hypothetical protein
MIVSNDSSLLESVDFLKAYSVVMRSTQRSNLASLEFPGSYAIVREHKKTFNLEAILGKNICKLLDAIYLNGSHALDFDEKDLFALVLSIYLQHVRNIIYHLAETMTYHPIVWKYIITNIACRDILTHITLEFHVDVQEKLTDDQILYLRDNLIKSDNNFKNRDWFGYDFIGDLLLINKSVYLFSANDLKKCDSENSFTCVMCGDDIDLESEHNDTVALCGIAGNECECFMCIECAYQTGRNLMNMVNDVNNTKCPGCEREMTREFYQIID